MKSCLILGAGRSGTSMMAGLLRNTGAFFGFEMLGASPANPRGYYEDRLLNITNNLIIRLQLRHALIERLPSPLVPRAHRDSRAFWAAAPRRLRKLRLPREIRGLLRTYAARSPFCYKDPRFCVTLPEWRRFLPADTRFVVVFRDPHRTVESLLRDAEASYDPPLRIPASWAYESWRRNYRRVIDEFSEGRAWFFVHYDQIIGGQAAAPLERFLGVDLDRSEVDSALSRSRVSEPATSRAARECDWLYQRLNQRAAESLAEWS